MLHFKVSSKQSLENVKFYMVPIYKDPYYENQRPVKKINNVSIESAKIHFAFVFSIKLMFSHWPFLQLMYFVICSFIL